MKKTLLILFAIFSTLTIHTFIYAQDLNNQELNTIAVSNETPNVQENNNDQDNYPTTYQPEYKPAFMKMFLILLLLLVLVFITFWMFKRIMKVRLHQSNLTKSIKIIEKRALSPKSILYLIEVEGKKVMISESNLEVRKIKDIEE